jgi:RNA polymerase sigma factor (TIGR02999 family)
MTAPPHQVTQLLRQWSEGDENALARLMPLVHDELHRLAHQHMRRESAGHVLQTSALINEAYLRLVDQPQIRWQGRAHFFGISARLMRHILVDEARKRNAAKRGGSFIQVPLEEANTIVQEPIDERQGKIVELRFFGGLSIEETAEVLKISPGTVMRDWTFARAWLRNEMTAA